MIPNPCNFNCRALVNGFKGTAGQSSFWLNIKSSQKNHWQVYETRKNCGYVRPGDCPLRKNPRGAGSRR